ncbi:hypothetical protein DJ90_5559 [Paenibacillus macerans]|uniref:Uncharacterized protein n=1 Tax=Paenibacillus macerans TaxID=44252 RepID=A0A090XFU2_PAEMA|nr:hypothetical protein DJ90_5559 [Paenibacillus macerans]
MGLRRRRNSNGCSSRYFAKKGFFYILTVVSTVIGFNSQAK